MNAAQHGVVIFGTSGHAAVCLDILQLQGKTVVGFIAREVEMKGKTIHEIPVVGSDDEDAGLLDKLRAGQWSYFIGVGDNARRKSLAEKLIASTGRPPINVIHPDAVVSRYAKVGTGVFINCGVKVNANAEVSDGALLNTSATIDHDCRILSYAQVSPGCNLGGGVVIEEGAFLGLGAVVLPKLVVGKGVVVGAGAVVVEGVPPGLTVVGVPAKPVAHT